jgi:hypothetical protein
MTHRTQFFILFGTNSDRYREGKYVKVAGKYLNSSILVLVPFVRESLRHKFVTSGLGRQCSDVTLRKVVLRGDHQGLRPGSSAPYPILQTLIKPTYL